MAVARLKKLSIYIHQTFKARIIDALQKEGCVEIVSDLEKKERGPLKIDETLDIEGTISQIDWAINILLRYEKPKRRKVPIKEKDLEDIKGLDHRDIFNRIKNLEERLIQIDADVNKLVMQRSSLIPWKDLDVDLETLQPTEEIEFLLGIVDDTKYKVLAENLLKFKFCLVEEVSLVDSQRYIIITVHKKEREKLLEVLKGSEFKKVEFFSLKGRPKDIINSIDSEIEKQLLEKKSLIDEYKRFSLRLPGLMIFYDHLINIRNKFLVEKTLYKSPSICMIEAWANSRDISRIKSRLFGICNLIHIESRDPKRDEAVPIILENKKLFRPFEFITKVYGLPSYNEVDPTPLLAPFFFIYFGFCVGDAGYGLIISILSLWALRRFRLGEYAKLLQILCLGGISVAVFGFITGGFFGNLLELFVERDGVVFRTLQNLKNSLILIDVNKEPVKLLTLALAFGIIQVWTGNLIAAVQKIRNRKILDSILDQGFIFLFIGGFTGLILGVFGVLPKGTNRLVGIFMAIGGLGILSFAGRENKNLGARLFGGVYLLYNTWSGYISDILSHSRLWALGLVSSIMAATCNIFGMMASQIPYVGILIAFLILIVGHAFIIIINILGALIHSGRLQFVEFFSKFFVGGGRPFKPFVIENRYTTFSRRELWK